MVESAGSGGPARGRRHVERETKGSIVVTVDQKDNIFVNCTQTPREQPAAGLKQAVEARAT